MTNAPRTALVTGASSGMGEATARRLAAAGHRVGVLGRRSDRITALANEIGGVALVADVGDAAAVDQAVATLGAPDLVVANAGIMLPGALTEARHAEWQAMFDVNALGVINVAHATLPGLLAAADAGRLADFVTVSSIAARVMFPGYAVYAASKAAATAFTGALRGEYAARGVRVTSVEPGLTATELGSHITDATKRDELAGMFDVIPPMQADDIAAQIAWLVSQPPNVNLAHIEVLATRQG